MRLKKVAFGLVMVCLVFSLLFSSGITVRAAEDITSADSAVFASVETSGNPVGTVIAFAGAVPPKGYLLCDGTSYSRMTYEDLYCVIGTIYGSTDGNTFKVPDLRGEFIRGVDNGRGVDAGRALGSWQEDMFESHNHWIENSSWRGDGRRYGDGEFCDGDSGKYTAKTGGVETRPRNVALNYCIKY